MYAYPCMTTARPMIPFSVSYTDGPFELIEYRRRGGFASKRQAHAPCAWLKGPDDCKTIRSVSSLKAPSKLQRRDRPHNRFSCSSFATSADSSTSSSSF